MSRRLSDAYVEFAEDWHPSRVPTPTTILFIGESPPAISTDVMKDYIEKGDKSNIPYFYNVRETSRCNRLAYAVSKLFFEPDKKAWKEGDRKARFLQKFQGSGFLLIDFFDEPLEMMFDNENSDRLKDCATRLLGRVHCEQHEDVIVLLKSLDEHIPGEIIGNSEHYRAVTFPTYGLQNLRNALEELHYVLDPDTRLFKKTPR